MYVKTTSCNNFDKKLGVFSKLVSIYPFLNGSYHEKKIMNTEFVVIKTNNNFTLQLNKTNNTWQNLAGSKIDIKLYNFRQCFLGVGACKFKVINYLNSCIPVILWLDLRIWLLKHNTIWGKNSTWKISYITIARSEARKYIIMVGIPINNRDWWFFFLLIKNRKKEKNMVSTVWVMSVAEHVTGEKEGERAAGREREKGADQ